MKSKIASVVLILSGIFLSCLNLLSFQHGSDKIEQSSFLRSSVSNAISTYYYYDSINIIGFSIGITILIAGIMIKKSLHAGSS
jgi:hypothetical protein